MSNRLIPKSEDDGLMAAICILFTKTAFCQFHRADGELLRLDS